MITTCPQHKVKPTKPTTFLAKNSRILDCVNEEDEQDTEKADTSKNIEVQESQDPYWMASDGKNVI